MNRVSREYLNKEQFDNLLSFCVIAGVFGFLIAAYFTKGTTSEQKSQIVTAMIGFGSGIIGFRWGSSRSANRSAETIGQLLRPSPGSTTVTTTQSSDEEGQNTTPSA